MIHQPIFKSETGSVLVVTLLVVLLLAALTMAFSDETGVELILAGASRESEQTYQTARSGIQAAMALLNGDNNKEVDTLKEEWSQAEKISLSEDLLEGSSVAVRIADECGKLNLNTLVNDHGEVEEARARQARKLFRILGVREELLDPLLDWLDQDEIKRIHGAESEHYRGLEYPYPCANSRFQTLDQLAMVKGYGRELVKESGERMDLSPYVTLYTDGKININTASPEVLQCLSEQLDSNMARAIAEYRKTEEFRSVIDLAKVPGFNSDVLNGVSPWLTVKSSAFSVESKGIYREGSRTVRAVVVRSGDKGRTRFIYWKVE